MRSRVILAATRASTPLSNESGEGCRAAPGDSKPKNTSDAWDLFAGDDGDGASGGE